MIYALTNKTEQAIQSYLKRKKMMICKSSGLCNVAYVVGDIDFFGSIREMFVCFFENLCVESSINRVDKILGIFDPHFVVTFTK